MREMEYRDLYGSLVIFRGLQDVIGQFPFDAPYVCEWSEWLHGFGIMKTLGICVVFLVVSIPIAMQVVCMSTMALGCRALAKKQAIVSRLGSIEELTGMEMLCSDKTGTVTQNIMTIESKLPWVSSLAVQLCQVLHPCCLSCELVDIFCLIYVGNAITCSPPFSAFLRKKSFDTHCMADLVDEFAVEQLKVFDEKR